MPLVSESVEYIVNINKSVVIRRIIWSITKVKRTQPVPVASYIIHIGGKPVEDHFWRKPRNIIGAGY